MTHGSGLDRDQIDWASKSQFWANFAILAVETAAGKAEAGSAAGFPAPTKICAFQFPLAPLQSPASCT
jgi:hypothetical protein